MGLEFWSSTRRLITPQLHGGLVNVMGKQKRESCHWNSGKMIKFVEKTPCKQSLKETIKGVDPQRFNTLNIKHPLDGPKYVRKSRVFSTTGRD
jgi:hypothetical protein